MDPVVDAEFPRQVTTELLKDRLLNIRATLPFILLNPSMVNLSHLGKWTQINTYSLQTRLMMGHPPCLTLC